MTSEWRRAALPFAATVLMATVACDREPTSPGQLVSAVQAKMTGPQALEGTIGPGALYGLYLPESWNGDLVLIAHGYCGFLPSQNSAEACFPTTDPSAVALRDLLLAQGFGVAWSSFSDWGLVIKDGAIRTAQLQGLFTSQLGRPAHTYLVGISLGAASVMHLAESTPGRFDGVVPICGIVGGLEFQLSHYWHLRALVDYYYPGVVPDRLMSSSEFMATVMPGLAGGIFGNLAKAAGVAAIDQIELAYNPANPSELLQSIMLPVMFQTHDRFAGGLIEALHGHNFFDNSTVQYSGSPDDAALNAGVTRSVADPDARNLLRSWYEPTGGLRIPMLSLHNTRDPVVPFAHEARYAGLVAANGDPELLVLRQPVRFGHCAFSAAEEAQAVFDLATWVTSGVKPTP